MIPRYARPEMSKIWSDENRIRIWLEIELAVLEAYADQGRIPRKDLEKIRAHAFTTVDEIEEREEKTQHDVIAFVEAIADKVGPAGRWIHMGLTSSDILDTATAIQIKQSLHIIRSDIEVLMTQLEKRAVELKHVITVGRTHGIHAEPMSFGLKFLLWYEEFRRHTDRLKEIEKRVAVGKISGAVGVYAHVDPVVESYVCNKFGLVPEPVSNQIVQRDRHAEYALTLAIIGASVEKVAMEIRHLQRTEVREAEEPFHTGQKGSSAMPHKRNPITAERLCGMARLLRGYALTALENVALWHERDISHSSTERIWMPDASILTDYMLERLAWIIGDLTVYSERMKENLALTRGLVFSSGILVALIEKGVSRQEAYDAVQRCAMRVWNENVSFEEALNTDDFIHNHLTVDELSKLMNPEYYIHHIDTVYDRILKKPHE